MGAKRQEDMKTHRLTDNATAAPGPKNDLSATTLQRQAIYGVLVGRDTIALMPAPQHDKHSDTLDIFDSDRKALSLTLLRGNLQSQYFREVTYLSHE